MLLGIVGLERVGKDTVANYLVSYHNFSKYNMALPIKQIGEIMFGWDLLSMETDKKDKVDPETNLVPRDFYKWFGTQICQYEIYKRFPQLKEKIPEKEIWTHIMKNFVDKNRHSNIIIPDIRFLHEVKALKDLGGTLIYLNKNNNSNFENYDLKEILDPKNKYYEYTLLNNKGFDTLNVNIERLLEQIKKDNEFKYIKKSTILS